MIHYELSLLLAVFAFTYSYILTRPKQFLNKFYRWLYEDVYKVDKTGKLHWTFKILIHCERCVAGQLALWIHLVAFHPYRLEYGWLNLWHVLQHLFFITTTIFIVSIIKPIYTKHIE